MIDEAALACCACCSIKWYVHEQDGLCFGEWRCDNCNRPFVPREHGAREREQLLLHVRDAEAEAKRAGERESELCGLLEELKGSAAEQQAEREQLRRELMEQRRIFDIELGNSHVAYLAVNTSYRQAERERDEARAALDQARVQLAGCLIAAEGGDTAEVCQGDYAWTLALETTRKLYAQIAERDVALAGAHDREDALQAALTSQQQATEEAMRRAEEARREMAAIRSELLLP